MIKRLNIPMFDLLTELEALEIIRRGKGNTVYWNYSLISIGRAPLFNENLQPVDPDLLAEYNGVVGAEREFYISEASRFFAKISGVPARDVTLMIRKTVQENA